MRQYLPKRHPGFMKELAALSTQIKNVVDGAGRKVVAVHARPRFSSSGVLWKSGIVVTAEHTTRREDDITITLPDGNIVPATLLGSDPRTDIAVLRVGSESGADAADLAIGAAAPPKPGEIALTIGRSKTRE